jgi:NAD(P)-dependent dehydrogenase (short-subunit alcohol dehydrogenase family)
MTTRLTNPPPQEQARQPGREAEMNPEPEYIREAYVGSRRLEGKTALITGGDSGIGRAVAVHFAAEGAAAVGIVYLEEDEDAARTAELVEGYGTRCVLLRGDVTQPDFAEHAVEELVREAGERIDVLVNNAAQQFPVDSVEELDYEQLDRTFRTNVYAHFSFVQACLPHMREGACIVNTTSVTA